jgi:thiol-disulfide isomerase/thioredoxin
MSFTGRWGLVLLSMFLLAVPVGIGAAERPEPSGKEGLTGLAVGEQFVDFGLKRLDPAKGTLAETVWLSKYIGPEASDPATVLVVNFFATWCAPCKAELPVLQRLATAHAARGVRVVSVNFRNEDETVEDAIAKTATLWKSLGLGFPVLFDRYTSRNQLAYMGREAKLPCNVLLRRDGRVLARLQGEQATPEALEAAVVKGLGAVAAPVQPKP